MMLRIAYLLFFQYLFSFFLLGEWSKPISLPSDGVASHPKIQMDQEGSAYVVYSVKPPLQESGIIFTKLFQGVVTETYLFPISPNSSAFLPNIGVDQEGNAMAAWKEVHLDTNVISCIGAYKQGETWNPPILLSEPDLKSVNPLRCPAIGISSKEKIDVFWEESAEGISSIQFCQLNQGDLLSRNILLFTTDYLKSPVYATSQSDYSIAAWINSSENRLEGTIFEKETYFTQTLSWNLFQGNAIPDPIIAMNTQGQGMILWLNSLGAIQSLSIPEGFLERISDYGKGIGTAFDISIDQEGNCLATWILFDPLENNYLLQIAHYKKGEWGEPKTLLGPLKEDTTLLHPKAALFHDQKGIIVWQQEVQMKESSIYTMVEYEGNWQTPKLLSNPEEESEEPELAISGHETAYVLWTANHSVKAVIGEHLFVNEELPECIIPFPPSSFSGKQIKKRFALFKEYFNRLKWEPNSDPTTISYNLYRNGSLIANLSKNGPFVYEDRFRLPGEKDIYELKSVNGKGMESVPLTVTLP